MPRPRARPRPADEQEDQEPCRCEGCEGRRRPGDAARPDADAAAPSALGLAAIRQERGLPRCLVLVGEGLLEDLEEAQASADDEEEEVVEEEEEEEDGGAPAPTPTQQQQQQQRHRREPRLPHLDRVAREGMLTPLQLRDLGRRGGGGLDAGGPAKEEDDGDERRRRQRGEAIGAQFWGAQPDRPTATSQKQHLAARFKGMRALALTAEPDGAFASAAAAVGAVVRPLKRPEDDDGDGAAGADAAAATTPERAARAALEALGLLDLPSPGPGEAEMVVIHVDAGAFEEDEADDPSRRRRRHLHRCLRWLDGAARAAFELGGEAARDALLLAVVLTPRDSGDQGAGRADDGAPTAAAAAPGAAFLSGRRRHRPPPSNDADDDDADPPPALPRPLQSTQLLAGAPVAVRPLSAAALCARRLPGAVRRCGAARLSPAQAWARGEGAVLMERLLPELAYKLGRAAKYGA
jgi:hypothetical protein